MRIILGIILLYSLFACQSPEDINNIELTEFSKELVSMYVNNEQNIGARNRKDEIIIVSTTSDTCCYLSVFANNSSEYNYCRTDFLGQTMYLGHTVRVFGNEHEAFFSIKRNLKKQEPCFPSYDCYDPNVWFICFKKNGSLYTEIAYQYDELERDLSNLQALVRRHFPSTQTEKENRDM